MDLSDWAWITTYWQWTYPLLFLLGYEFVALVTQWLRKWFPAIPYLPTLTRQAWRADEAWGALEAVFIAGAVILYIHVFHPGWLPFL